MGDSLDDVVQAEVRKLNGEVQPANSDDALRRLASQMGQQTATQAQGLNRQAFRDAFGNTTFAPDQIVTSQKHVGMLERILGKMATFQGKGKNAGGNRSNPNG